MTLTTKQLHIIDNGMGNPEQQALVDALLKLRPTVSFMDFSHSKYLEFSDPSQTRPEQPRESFCFDFDFPVKDGTDHRKFAAGDLEVAVVQAYVKIKELILRMHSEASIDTTISNFGTIELAMTEEFAAVEIGVHRLAQAIIVGVGITENSYSAGSLPPVVASLTVSVHFSGLLR